MPNSDYPALDLLTAPVWIVAGRSGELLFANPAAQRLAAVSELCELRHGLHSALAEENLAAYLPALRSGEVIVEIWTMHRDGNPFPLSCRLSLLRQPAHEESIVVEGMLASLPSPAVAPLPAPGDDPLYAQLFHANGAPMLLIDPAADGRIVDANQAACRFYGHSREEFCRRHTWEINALGRQVLPIMNQVAQLPGGHRPLNFVHRVADGSLRDVQTYASPLNLGGKRLMLCVIHDVTEQKRLRHELEFAASRDPLTGLWNRRHCLELLDKAWQRNRRQDAIYSLMILDADYFKVINDQFGHEKGDEVLILLAKTLENRVRETDAVCRWGGEEFIVLLPQTNIENAALLAECLRACVTELRIPGPGHVTVSIGVAQCRPEESTESLLRRADAALYRAKEAGRNRVVTADEID